MARRGQQVHTSKLGSFCLVHNYQWKDDYMHAIDSLRGGIIPVKYIPRINRFVCNCGPEECIEDPQTDMEKGLQMEKYFKPPTQASPSLFLPPASAVEVIKRGGYRGSDYSLDHK